jgi:hypothetical protein
MQAMEMPVSPLLTRPKYSSISFGLFPAAVMRDGDSIRTGIPVILAWKEPMTEICLCCVPADAAVAEAVAERLHRTAEVLVRIEAAETPVSEAWEAGLESAGVLILLSPEAMPAQRGREPWEALLAHSGRPEIALLEIRPCAYPPLLKRRAFFQWPEPRCLRELQRWAVGLHVEQEAPFQPAAIPGFQGELETLWAALVDGCGTVAVDDVRLAQEFAHRAAPYFRDVLWIGCLGRSLPFVAGDIAAALGIALDGPADNALHRALALARRHRLLVVLDGIEVPPDCDAAASVLCVRERELPVVESDDPLLKAMSVCLRGGFPIELPAQIAGVPADGVAAEWSDCLDKAGRRYRLRVAARPDAAFRRRHAEILRDSFSRWIRHPEANDRLAAEVEPAIRWALVHDWELGTALAQAASGFFRDRQRHLETGVLVSLPGVQFMRPAPTHEPVQIGFAF